MSVCAHRILSFASSGHAEEAGYSRPTAQQRIAATTMQGSVQTRKTKRRKTNDSMEPCYLNDVDIFFPAPLVLPGDDLSVDTNCPPQSLRAWNRLKDRNEVTPAKNVIYVAGPPLVDENIKEVRLWCHPAVGSHKNQESIKTPSVEDVVPYLAAFFHGMPVKSLPVQLSFVPWDSPNQGTSRAKSSKSLLQYIGLNTSTECVRIRTRHSADKLFSHQLNLNDLLDAALEMLPNDAYALLMLVDHDLYESSNDEFCCGRAYGASRIAVVSTARYNPLLDSLQFIDREHAWPASHCKSFIEESCVAAAQSSRRHTLNTNNPKGKSRNAASDPQDSDATSAYLLDRSLQQASTTALEVAVSNYTSLLSRDLQSPAAQNGMWLGSVCRTASHELGHCLGLEHCVYYACLMQSTASLAEDARQPPYLCPVDEAKILRATKSKLEDYSGALLHFFEKHKENHLFVAFAAWIRERLRNAAEGERCIQQNP